MIVVDASALLELLLRMPSAEAVEQVVFAPGETLHAPHLIDIEVVQVLRRYAADDEIGEARGQAAIADLSEMPLQRYPHGLLLPRIWQLRNNLSTYDAAYVALAEALDSPLLTRDRRLAAAPGNHARIRLI
jgi:predicted nucleic acid-binding protein